MRIVADRLAPALSLVCLFLAPCAVHASDAREDVFKAYQKMMGSRFAVDITTVSDGSSSRSHGEYDTVERIHFRNDRMEMIVLPEGTWMRMGKDWTKPPVDMSGMVKQFVPKSIEDMKAVTRSATDDGMTTWNGQPAHAYSYSVDTTMMGIHVTSTNKIFVNAAGQIVHVESDGEAMGRKSHTTQDVKYDDSIKVTAPT
ncbi:MAG TPA: hypothetical protein VHE32_06765 [Rhodanobacteraceae bacterium]|nr:hypothetical protein [Rhodanobacteraceae bacterium]